MVLFDTPSVLLHLKLDFCILFAFLHHQLWYGSAISRCNIEHTTGLK